jgi:membrane protein DedA with SNARE-associated domain
VAVFSVAAMIEESGGAEPAGGIAGWVVQLMESFGALGVGLANVVDIVLPIVPSELILPLAGFTAGQGRLSLAAVIVWATAGSVLGSLIVYACGALFGRERVRAIAARIPLFKADEIDRAEAWFARHGTKAVFFGRMVPLIRSLISVPAGIERMPIGTFTLFTTAGSLIWNTAFILAGYWLGENWRLVEEYAGLVSKAVVIVALVAVAYFVVSRLARSRV